MFQGSTTHCIRHAFLLICVLALVRTLKQIDYLEQFGLTTSGADVDQLLPTTRVKQMPKSQFSCLQAERNTNKRPAKVNFLTAAVGKEFEDIVPLYVFYALTAHPGAVAEIIVPNRTSFLDQYTQALTWLHDSFSVNGTDSLCVREYSDNHGQRTAVTGTWRFLEVPVLLANYTYIGDIDIFLTESVLNRKRLKQMKEFNIPYSNIVRDYTAKARRLTGVMLIETQNFYTPALIDIQKTIDARGNDEHVLYKIVEEAGLGIPPANSTSNLLKYRPVHGVHLSYNRGPWRKMCTRPLDEFNKLLEVDRIDEYRAADHTADRYLAVQQTLVEIQDRGQMAEIKNQCIPTNQSASNTT